MIVHGLDRGLPYVLSPPCKLQTTDCRLDMFLLLLCSHSSYWQANLSDISLTLVSNIQANQSTFSA